LIFKKFQNSEISEIRNGFNYSIAIALFSIVIHPSIIYHIDVIKDYAEKIFKIGKNKILNVII